MPKINIHHQHQLIQSDYEVGDSLLQIIRQHNIEIAAPCGGRGTCGKCRVRVKGIGYVTSCIYYPDQDLEVVIPRVGESKVLTDQHQYSLSLALNPGVDIEVSDEAYGVAIDIGTTSIAFYLIDLSTGHVLGTQGVANSQGQYGADVVSRINHCAQPDGLKQLQYSVIKDINEQLAVMCQNFSLSPDAIVKISISANNTMLHLLLGVDPTSIALAPFVPTFTKEKWLETSSLNIEINPQAKVHILPSVSAYVGADIVSGLASLKPEENLKNYLFVDVGTNGEMALVTSERIWCTATAAGPALEGANISCGMGAYPGAISAFANDQMHCINDEKPVGLCGSGLIDVIAHLLDKGILGMEGLLMEDFILASANESGHGEVVALTPQDVREVQLAKSAIFTGIQTLMSVANLGYDDVDALFLAGGLGNYLNVESAIRIGLLPQEMKDKTIQVGNTSGTGAVLDICSVEYSHVMADIVEKSEALDLSTDPNFEMNFAMNMFFS